MKKHIVLISVGVLNVLHGSFHIIQFIQSMFFVAYATHDHDHHDGVIEKVMHNPIFARSEEHTSELQSHHDLVCRLLLEEKKINSTAHTSSTK